MPSLQKIAFGTSLKNHLRMQVEDNSRRNILWEQEEHTCVVCLRLIADRRRAVFSQVHGGLAHENCSKRSPNGT